jgi:general secretion pathway protein F
MTAFEYAALDNHGRERKGILEGDTPRQVRQLLREQGWIPLHVDEVQRREAQVSQVRLRGRIGATDLALVTRQLATLVKASSPVEEALQAVAEQSEKRRIKRLLMGVRSRVLEGHSLAAALDDFPHAFPELYRATVAAGEQSGYLESVLERLADYTETRQQTSQKILLALIYPVMITGVALLVVIALLTYVVPEIIQVFRGVGQTLPGVTRSLIALSNMVRDYGLFMLGALVGSAVAFSLLRRREGFRFGVQRWVLALPLVGRLVRGVNTARFARTLSILAASGVPVLEALRISASVLSSLPMRTAVLEAAQRVAEGSNIHTALERNNLFPPLTLHLIASGEASGDLEGMLERAAESQQRELDTLVGALLGLLEPVLILLMGGMVLYIVVAILLPIFELNQLVK